MKSIASTIERILRLQADQGAEVRERDFGRMLSPFLRGTFDTYEAEAARERFCVARACDEDYADAGIAKKAATLENAIGMPVALYFADMVPALKRDLIKDRRGFVSAAGDLYLPHMALSLAAPSSEPAVVRGDFTSGEQALFLYCLYNGKDHITQAGAMDILGVSSATVSRALSSLADRGLVDYDISGSTGRLKEYFVSDKRTFYRDGVALFGSPVHTMLMASLETYDERLLFSGLSALSILSDLTRPTLGILAASRAEAKEFGDYEIHHMGGEQRYLVQVLRYDPRPLARMVWGDLKCVDPITMLLTLNDSDERISIAAREVMGRFEWYTE